MKKIKNNQKILLAILVIFMSFTFISGYDSGWQNFRTQNNYVVCGKAYPSCNLQNLGLNWYSPNNGKIYDIICGELQEKGRSDCLLWESAGIGRYFNVPENNDYYLSLGIFYEKSSAGNDETMIGGYDWSWEGAARQNIGDLGSGDKECVMRNTFPVTMKNIHNKIWLKGTGGSVNPYKFKLSTCISQEDVDKGLVYCDNGQPAVANCPIECNQNIQNTSWTEWEDLNCYGNQRNQSRTRTEYDTNNCGNFTNKTYTEFRLIEDSECQGCLIDSDCPEDFNSSLYCYEGNSYLNSTTHSCIEGNCENSTSRILIEECEFDCLNGTCQEECCNNSDCPEDFNSSLYCIGNEIYLNNTNWFCSELGLCENNVSQIFIENCPYGCLNGTCQNETQNNTLKPLVNITFPENLENYNYNITNAYVDLIFYENSDTCWFNLNNQTNKTFTCVNGSTNFSISSKEGINELQVWVNDTNGNQTMEQVVYIVDINSTAPNITIISPENINYDNSIINLEVIADQEILNWSYNLNGTWINFNPNITINVNEGQHTLRVNGTNNNGTGYDIVEFYVNLADEDDDEPGTGYIKINQSRDDFLGKAFFSGFFNKSYNNTKTIKLKSENKDKISGNSLIDLSWIAIPLVILLIILCIILILRKL